MIEDKNYNPNTAIHPGVTLREMLESLEMSQVGLSRRTGLTPKTINEIVQGENPITPKTAIKLSAVFGMSASFWNNLQRNYEQTLLRLQIGERIQEELSYFKKFTCYQELAKYGYVKKTNILREKVFNLLNFFGVSSLRFVRTTHSIAFSAVAFRKCDQKSLSQESLAAWLRCGELSASNISTKNFNKEKLKKSLPELKSLTKERPDVFQERMVEICSSFGVAVVFIPYFKSTYVNAATRWLSSDKTMIQLSLRGKRSDIFWFDFFHELGHLLKDGKKDQCIKFIKDKRSIRDEKEANDFASETLIPKREFDNFIHIGDFSRSTIKSFANTMGVSQSIVAGRLSHHFNDFQKWSHLRTKLQFDSED